LEGAAIENVSFDNIHLTFGGGGTAEEGARRELPEVAGEYFTLGPMPAYSFYARNARGLTQSNVRLQLSKPDLRPALIFDHVEDAAVSLLGVHAEEHSESALRIISSKDILVTSPRLLTPTSTFLQIEGKGNERITLEGGDISRAATPVVFKYGAETTAVRQRG
jgi:hypothetical protein